MWHPTKLALGAVIAAGFVAYYVALERNCANMTIRCDGGELIITSGGTADGTQTGLRLLAPKVAFSKTISLNGTAEARLLRIDNLCDSVLDCSSCPPKLRLAFNTSVLDGTLLVCDPWTDVRLIMCGDNRMARALGRTGLAGILQATEVSSPLFTPGMSPRLFRLGAPRDAIPRDGDVGIPFPFIHVEQYAFNPLLGALDNGAQIRGVMMPAAPNPWQSTMCGYWKPLRTIIMVGHVWVAERAASCFVGHVQSAGMRFDLAQAASVTEMMAHLLLALSLHDPVMAFHWGLLPFGTNVAVLICPVVFTCSSTLLLAGFWYVASQCGSPSGYLSYPMLFTRSQMIAHDGLASVLCETRPARILAGIAVFMNVLALYFFFTEVKRWSPKLSARPIFSPHSFFAPLCALACSFSSLSLYPAASSRARGVAAMAHSYVQLARCRGCGAVRKWRTGDHGDILRRLGASCKALLIW